MPDQKLEIGATLRAMRVSFEENGALIARLTFAFAAITALATLLDITGPAGFAISFGITLLLGAGYGGMVTAVICLPGKSEEVAELWAVVKPLLARLIWVTLVTALAVLAGMALLIIPGLIVLTIWSVAGQVIVVERKGVFDSLGRSYQLVQKTAWQVFGFLISVTLIGVLLLLMTLLISAPLEGSVAGKVVSTFLGNLVVTPLLAIAAAELFNQLSRIESPLPSDR